MNLKHSKVGRPELREQGVGGSNPLAPTNSRHPEKSARSLPPQPRAEPQAIFRGWDGGAAGIEDDEFYLPRLPTSGRGMSRSRAAHPILSARPALSAAEMRPTAYLRWKNDPACRIV